jgi:hypothetical protein
MNWLKTFVYVFGMICCIGLMLFGLSFIAVLLAQWIPLRPDVLIGLLLLAAIAIATVMELIKAASDDDGR